MTAPLLRLPALADAYDTSPAPECYSRHYQFDAQNRIIAVKLLPGQYHVATTDILQATVLGSCVTACIRDTRLGIGGMNHFMLPEHDGVGPVNGAARYGAQAMDMLIVHLTRLGARREHLEAKVFGGGAVISGLTLARVGERNAAFVLEYLAAQRVRVAARDLADIYPRRVHFYPASGRVLVKRLSSQANTTLAERERAYRQRLQQMPLA